jgi:putative membrane protein
MRSHRQIKPALLGFLFFAMGLLGVPSVAGSAQDSLSMDKAFLQKAAEGQQAEIALGQLAKQQAFNEQVKAFGECIVQDHEKASREVQQLASKEGYQDFDRAYMEYSSRTTPR